MQGQNQKMICCLCCATGPIVAEFRLERRGYVPGEPIRLFADIRNNSNRKMDRSYIDLRMVSCSRSNSLNHIEIKQRNLSNNFGAGGGDRVYVYVCPGNMKFLNLK